MRIIAASVVAALLAACGDVHSLIVVTPEADGGPDGGPDGVAIDDGGATTADADGSATVDSGAAADGGTVDGATEASPDPVFGSSVFVPGSPGQNANAVTEHAAGELPLQGKNCFKAGGCHSENNHKYGFAGTLYESVNGGATIKNAEIRMSDQSGALIGLTYTDDDGNFWFEGPKPPVGARVGVRKGLSKGIMTDPVAGDTDAACNSGACHGATSLRIFLP